MHYSSITERLGTQANDAWRVHWEAQQRKAQGEDIITLTVGDPGADPSIGAPDILVETTVNSLRKGRNHYTALRGEPYVIQAVVDAHNQRYKIPINSDQVCVTFGAQGGLYLATNCLVEKGDEVIVLEPTYSTYFGLVQATGAKLVLVAMRPEENFRINSDRIEAAITPNTRLIMLNTPSNPTGNVATREELEALAGICKKHDLWLIVDEVYGQLTYDRDHFSPADLPGMAERTVIVHSLSKSHAMPGFRIGWSVAPAELTQYMGQLFAYISFGIPPFAQDALLAALTIAADEVEAMQQIYLRRRDLVCNILMGLPNIKLHRPEAGVFLLIDIRETGQTAFEFALALLKGSGVAVLPGDGFGPSAEGHVRISLTTPDDELAKGCERIAAYLQRAE